MDPESYIRLTTGQVALAAALLLINGAVSVALSLGLERRLLVAATRAAVQLTLVGLVLKSVFELKHWPLVVLLMAAMTAVAGVSAVQRISFRFPGIWITGLVSVWASAWLVAAAALGAVVGVRPWYTPQYAIPLLGMILGNALNGIALGLDRFAAELSGKRDQVDMLLSLGATRWEAARQPAGEAVRNAMIPILNTMSVAGLVSLPGMMTGQLLAGVEPVEAVKYQIVIIFLIAAATACGSLLAVLLSFRRLFSPWHQFRRDVLRPAGK